MDKPKPPRLAYMVLQWYCNPKMLEELEGDLYEVYLVTLNEKGKLRAQLAYWFLVIKSFRSYAVKREESNYKTNFIIMYRSNIRIAVRNFNKNKGYGLINLGGLIIGTVSCLLISLYVAEELSYDQFHHEARSIFRIRMDRYEDNQQLFQSAVTFPAVGPALNHGMPEVQDFLRILPFGNGVYTYTNTDGIINAFNEENAVFADHNFFTLFNFALIKGAPEEVLSKPFGMVLSETTAKKYFGDDDPIGKILVRRGSQEYEITGVMSDMPANSHMNFDMILSLSSLSDYDEFPENWGWYDFYTFVKLSPEADITTLSQRFSQSLQKYKGQDPAKQGTLELLALQPITDIHLYSQLSWDMGDNGSGQSVYFLLVIAFLILIIAWVNFINLSSARAIRRAREVGIRKVVGALRGQLVGQFLTESFLYNFLAIIISVSTVYFLLPWINVWIDLKISAQHFYQTEFILVLAGVLVAGTLLSGLYPAFLLTHFKPADVLKGKRSRMLGTNFFRKFLVIFQFTVSLVLIVGTFLVIRQLHFMKSQDLGIDIKQTLVLNSPTSIADRQDLISRIAMLRNELNGLPEIKGTALSSTLPGRENFSISNYGLKSNPENQQDIYRVTVDYNFLNDFNVAFLSGRNFSPDFPSDSTALIINDVARERFLIENPEKALQEYISVGQYEYKIVGVIESYHQESLKKELDPVMYFLNNNTSRFISIKLETQNLSQSMEKVTAVWKSTFPDAPLDYYFLEDSFNNQYKADARFNVIFVAFAGLAIFVACLGLLGLVSIAAEERIREISIRKVMGSSLSAVVLLIFRDFFKLILAAIIIAMPVAYFLMESWLTEFPYRISISVDIFFYGALITLMIAMLTISYHSVNAARSNPAEVLRNE